MGKGTVKIPGSIKIQISIDFMEESPILLKITNTIFPVCTKVIHYVLIIPTDKSGHCLGKLKKTTAYSGLSP